MVRAHSHRISRVPWYSGYRLAITLFAYGDFTLCVWSSQGHSAKSHGSITRSEPQAVNSLVWALSRSLAATWEITFVFFSSGYLDVSVHRVPFHALFYWRMDTWGVPMWVAPFRYPRLIMDICSWPRLFAAYHVFHRLSVPRHPPCALFT